MTVLRPAARGSIALPAGPLLMLFLSLSGMAIGLAVDGFVTAPTAALDDRIPLSSGTREVLRRAVAGLPQAAGRRTRAERVLLALLEREHPDPAAVLLDELGVHRDAVLGDMRGPRR